MVKLCEVVSGRKTHQSSSQFAGTWPRRQHQPKILKYSPMLVGPWWAEFNFRRQDHVFATE